MKTYTDEDGLVYDLRPREPSRLRGFEDDVQVIRELNGLVWPSRVIVTVWRVDQYGRRYEIEATKEYHPVT